MSGIVETDVVGNLRGRAGFEGSSHAVALSADLRKLSETIFCSIRAVQGLTTNRQLTPNLWHSSAGKKVLGRVHVQPVS